MNNTFDEMMVGEMFSAQIGGKWCSCRKLNFEQARYSCGTLPFYVEKDLPCIQGARTEREGLGMHWFVRPEVRNDVEGELQLAINHYKKINGVCPNQILIAKSLVDGEVPIARDIRIKVSPTLFNYFLLMTR